MKYEYAVFTVRVPFDRARILAEVSDIAIWPDQAMQAALLVKMNELGEEGWEIFERAYPSIPPRTNDETYPYNLWARRRKAEARSA